MKRLIALLRWAFTVAVWLYAGAILLLTFLVGLGFFSPVRLGLVSRRGYLVQHAELGWLVALASLLLVLMALAARPGWRLVGLTVLLALLSLVQALLPGLRGQAAWLAALHPVNALILFWVAVQLGRRSAAVALGASRDEGR